MGSISNEYRENENLAPYTDVYALGAVLYEALTGKLLQKSMDRLFQDEVKAPCDMNSQVSYEMSKVIMKAIELNPANRYQSMEKFEQALISDEVSGSLMRRTWQEAVLLEAASLAIFIAGML